MTNVMINGERFLEDVANHDLSVRQDNGLYRHLIFRQPMNSWNMWFEIVTWPGSLAIHGDMGTWTFSRLDDMFAFFRSVSTELKINESYWCEKISSESRFGGPSKKFNAEIDGEGYTYHYLWCLYAIVWAIQQYDIHRQSGPASSTSATRSRSTKKEKK